MGKRSGERSTGPKCIAIVGPFASGKTSLFEAMLARTGAIASKHGRIRKHGRRSFPEAKSHKMSVEGDYRFDELHGRSITFVDCPGSVEFAYEAEPVLAAATWLSLLRKPTRRSCLPAIVAAPAGRSGHSPRPVSQQNRQGQFQRARNAETFADRIEDADAPAPNPDLAERHCHWLH